MKNKCNKKLRNDLEIMNCIHLLCNLLHSVSISSRIYIIQDFKHLQNSF